MSSSMPAGSLSDSMSVTNPASNVTSVDSGTLALEARAQPLARPCGTLCGDEALLRGTSWHDLKDRLSAESRTRLVRIREYSLADLIVKARIPAPIFVLGAASSLMEGVGGRPRAILDIEGLPDELYEPLKAESARALARGRSR